MDEFWQRVLANAPTVAVMLWIFMMLRQDVMAFMNAILRLLEKCMENTDDNDTSG